MARSTEILSKVFRNLRRDGIKIEDLLDQEIYDEISLGQDRIISDAFPDQIVKVTFVSGTDTYKLSTDTTDPQTRKNIASVKIAKLPTGWTTFNGVRDYGNVAIFPQGFSVVPTDDFINMVNANQGLTGRPRIGIIVNSNLQVYPVPSDDEDGEIIELYCYISSSSGVVDDDNEPEVPNYYDKALEIFGTAQFQDGDKRTNSLLEFTAEVKRVRSIYNRKHHNLARKPIEGFL